MRTSKDNSSPLTGDECISKVIKMINCAGTSESGERSLAGRCSAWSSWAGQSDRSRSDSWPTKNNTAG